MENTDEKRSKGKGNVQFESKLSLREKKKQKTNNPKKG
jgi:hypothetical protein